MFRMNSKLFSGVLNDMTKQQSWKIHHSRRTFWY